MGRLHRQQKQEGNKQLNLLIKVYPLAMYPYPPRLRMLAGLEAQERCRQHAQAVAVALDPHVHPQRLG